MNADDIKTLVRKRPFEPLEIGLSDGRTVFVRHPDQAVVARRHVIFGLAQSRNGGGRCAPDVHPLPHGRGSQRRQWNRGSRIATPDDGDAVAKDGLHVDLVHVVSAEPADGDPGGAHKRRKR